MTQVSSRHETNGAVKDQTPAMRQYHHFKQRHPGCVLFFRMGDFYEMFHDDAKLANKVLGVTLTQRTEGIPMAGVPYHAVEGYLRRMIQAGYRVAVCDQVEDAAQAKGLVKRDVTRVITPGTLTDETLLDESAENPLAAVVFHSDEQGSLAWSELSTGSFHLTTLPAAELADELARIRPKELLYCETATGDVPDRVAALTRGMPCVLSGRPPWQFRLSEAVEILRKQFQVAQLTGFGLDESDPAVSAAGGIVHYLLETQCNTPHGRLPHLRPPKQFNRNDNLVIDQTSLQSLEVEQTIRGGSAEGSLLATISDCVTAMGKRKLRHWLCYPLARLEPIEQRQRVVESLVNDSRLLSDLRDALQMIQDVERITARLAVNRANGRDLVALGRSTERIEVIAGLLSDRPAVTVYHGMAAKLHDPLKSLAEKVGSACVDQAPAHLRDGGLIRDGYDRQLDEYRSLQRDSHSWLAGYQKQLIEQTGVTNLKVGYNKVFGYYIELTAANRDKAPDIWSRKQTLKNAERYITPELKDFENKVLSAESRAVNREQQLFDLLCEYCQKQHEPLHHYAELIAELDVLGCFARRAVRCRYVKPLMVEQPVLHIHGGRHPVLDDVLGERFVPNDVELGERIIEQESDEASATVTDPASLALITGPNMAGKSTYIRQAALITLLAHSGSFVPADRAVIGICDRIFTRIGASDELHTGQSTFMVEMTETANICHHATGRSLVILDEIGRGTSTLDGLSLAWAIAEYLAVKSPRCLFATHYHELTGLSEQYPNVTNLNVTVREWQDQIVFLHRIVPGATDRSYGIHVAKIAGLPDSIVMRANELLGQLAVNHVSPAPTDPRPKAAEPSQLSLFTEYINHPVVDDLNDLDLTAISPLQAFDLLRELQNRARHDGKLG